MAAHGRGKGWALLFHPRRNCKLRFTTCNDNLLGPKDRGNSGLKGVLRLW
jgi:hypothetical protein